MRLSLALCVLAAAVGCGAGSAAPAAEPTTTDLKITVWPDGRSQAGADVFTLKCGPARGSLPKVATACTRLLKLSRPFAPVSRTMMCTEQYGGPQQALVTGTFRGRSVWATFAATNGCQISRARLVSFLLPGFGTSASA